MLDGGGDPLLSRPRAPGRRPAAQRPDEIANCAPYLEEEIRLIRPLTVIAVGQLAITKFLPEPAPLAGAGRAGVPGSRGECASTWSRCRIPRGGAPGWCGRRTRSGSTGRLELLAGEPWVAERDVRLRYPRHGTISRQSRTVLARFKERCHPCRRRPGRVWDARQGDPLYAPEASGRHRAGRFRAWWRRAGSSRTRRGTLVFPDRGRGGAGEGGRISHRVAPSSLSGDSPSVSGRAPSHSGGAPSLSGGALSLSGGALSLSGRAPSLSGM